MRIFRVSKLKYIFLIGGMFVLIVFLVILFGIAVNHEKETASIVRNIRVNFRKDMASVILDVNVELSLIERELRDSAVFPSDLKGGDYLRQWKQRSSWVDVPFLIPDGKGVLLPSQGEIVSSVESEFFTGNLQFLSGKSFVPVFKSIVLVYNDKIITEASRIAVLRKPEIEKEHLQLRASSFGETDYSRAFDGQLWQAGLLLGSDLIVDKNDPHVAAYAAVLPEAHEICVKRLPVLDMIDDSAAMRKKIYRLAVTGGWQIYYKGKPGRNAVSPLLAGIRDDRFSEFISKPETFNMIIGRSDSGIIPRIIEGNLILIFWKKDPNGDIAGCLIDRNVFVERLRMITAGWSSQNDDTGGLGGYSLLILDEHGLPLGVPFQNGRHDFGHPFYYREISEKIPYWEVAGYPPGNYAVVLAKARKLSFVLWGGVAGLLVFIAAGVTLVLKFLFWEVKLARQKTTFVANVSHELKTPLTSIRMLTELLKSRRQADEKKKEEYLDMVISETERLTRLINDVLDFSGLERGKKMFNFQPVNIVSLCRAAFEVQKVRLAHNGFEVRFLTEYDELNVKADEESLVRVIINLLSNAEKYSADKKEIALEVSKHHGFALITIFDRGIGIPVEKAKDLFKEFSRVDNRMTAKVKGTGLGLAIAKHIMLAHKGDIQYFPRDGGGSIFQVKVPLMNS
ncbi:MAG: HAMP domain-containing sensor histidine kinase [Candidatus Omnitrophica bacterium]|nr:HAMP domain-containing sensor histidine kinase [Candidatus Omnitrophota bacterium]